MKRLCRFVVLSGAMAVMAACGKKGDPLPPLRPVPARITDVTVVRTADRVELRFTVPAANLDGTSPPAIDRVDVYALATPAGAAAPSAPAIIAEPRNVRSRVPIRRPVPDVAPPPGPAPLAPGDAAVVVDRLQGLGDPLPATVYFVVQPVAGTGRGRQGPPSPPLAVPLGPLPAAPVDVALSHDEATVRVTWQAGTAGQTFRAARTSPTGTELTDAAPLTPTPVTQSELSFPVEFAREVCVAVRTVQVSGAVSQEGAPSRPACLTPVDRYPPPAPSGVQGVQEGTSVTVIWNAVDAPDLAGYIVLRGVGGADTLEPLMRTPIRETTYRDTTVQPGVAYTYAVYAVDNAPTANVSQLSARQSVTVR